MAIPNSNSDAATISRALQVIQRLLELNPGIYAKHNLQMIFNLVHYPNQAVREDVAKLIMTLSTEFDDQNSLLELQKINPQKNNYDEFSVNFQEEPNKSQKQLLRLVRLFEKDVQTRSQYLTQINKVLDEEPEDMIVPNMERLEISKILTQDCEERAALLFETFFRLTSVVYDV